MTSFRLLSPRDFRCVPWRNGGGTTMEIATWPPEARAGEFRGRVSIARLDRDGAFSTWPGIDRTFLLLDGAGVVLAHDAGEVALAALHEPYRFSGDRASSCRLVGGPARAFNLMVRRGEAHGEVALAEGASALGGRWRAGVCYAVRGACECLFAGRAPVSVAEGGALVVDEREPETVLHVNPLEQGAVAVVASLTFAA
ncbi:MAG TPA: HutD family protein [Casimicrobiaceae bacterium]|nr:HutD family protein [Casimicrobiaceae bacterium]